MKSIGYMDIVEGKTIRVFNPKQNINRHERIRMALDELKGMGNIIIYLINGNKYRKLFKR